MRLAARFTAFDIADRGLLCIAEGEARWFEGPIYKDLAERLRTPTPKRSILLSLSESYGVEKSEAVLEEFEALGLAVESASHLTRSRHAYWEQQSGIGAVALELLTQEGAQTIRQALENHHFSIREDAPLRIVSTDDYLRPELAQIAALPTAWLLVKPVGHTIWVGPLFAPGNQACWGCLAAALKMNRWRQATVFGWSEHAFPPEPSVAATPASLALAAGLVAAAAASWAWNPGASLLGNAVFSLDTRTLRHSMNLIGKSPGCSLCRRDTPPPRRTLDALISPITGIVSHLSLVSDPVGGICHARAEYVHPLPVPGTRPLLDPMFSLGFGITESEAQDACVAEAVERYSTTYQGRELRVLAKAADLDSIHPSDILLFSESQYAQREVWNRTRSELHFVPFRFEPFTSIEWVPARSMMNSRIAYVAAAYCYFSYYDSGGQGCCRADSNGCAAGQTIEKAILSALLELIERDAVAIWWYNRIRRPAVSLDSFGLVSIDKIRESLERDGRSIYLLDVTCDLDIPVYVAVAPKHDGSEPFFASAAHVSPALAAFKALKELSQIHFWAKRGSFPDELASWLKIATLLNQPYLEPDGVLESAMRPVPHERDYLQHSLERLRLSGLEPFYVDMTRPEIGIPAVRAIVPGLRHFWTRLGPGRLYDVPVQMGWLSEARTEHEMNPIGCML